MDLDALLEKTSRTFALSIPLLPDPTRREVTVAYLLFRIADTFEDADRWPRRRRLDALGEFADCLRVGSVSAGTAGRWRVDGPTAHDGYLELLERSPEVLEAFAGLRSEARETVAAHLSRTVEGMAGFVARADASGSLRLEDMTDLRGYCYAVAGIVGELCTDLFLLGRPALEPSAGSLRDLAPLFGEGLQLVNILKDAATDASAGRVYLPPQVTRSDVFGLARRDLVAATEYVATLQESGCEPGLVAFNALPVQLAWATLERVEERGPGAKVGRPTVWRIVREVKAAARSGAPAATVPAEYATT